MVIRCSSLPKVLWRVTVDGCSYETLAASAGRAARNIAYRIVMRDRAYRVPRVRDRMAMRDLVIEKVERT